MSSAFFKASPMPDDAIELGRIQEAFGIKGWVRIHPHSADTSALLAAKEWHLQPPEAKFARGFSAFTGVVAVEVGEIKAQTAGIVARIEGLDDRTAAEGLKGVRISVPRSAFPATPEGEYYWVDLIGLRVVNREGVEMGIVRDLITTGPNSVLVLETTETTEDGKEQQAERLIPFVAAYVDGVDKQAKLITVDWQLDY
jgi:16S rRNA processing protein RimM